MRAYYDQIRWEGVFSGNDVEHNWNVLKEVILKAQKCFIPSANRKAKQSPGGPTLTNAVKKNPDL